MLNSTAKLIIIMQDRSNGVHNMKLHYKTAHAAQVGKGVFQLNIQAIFYYPTYLIVVSWSPNLIHFFTLQFAADANWAVKKMEEVWEWEQHYSCSWYLSDIISSFLSLGSPQSLDQLHYTAPEILFTCCVLQLIQRLWLVSYRVFSCDVITFEITKENRKQPPCWCTR